MRQLTRRNHIFRKAGFTVKEIDKNNRKIVSQRRGYLIAFILIAISTLLLIILTPQKEDAGIENDDTNNINNEDIITTVVPTNTPALPTEPIVPTATPTVTPVASYNNAIYVAPKLVYEDDNIVISVKGYVESSIYGPGLRFEYKNKTLNEIKIEAIAEANQDSRKEIVLKANSKTTGVVYLGTAYENFTQETFAFTIIVPDKTYETGQITIMSQ